MRADRLISMMLLLNAKGQMTAQDLAAELEVSERTIYRDVDALCVAGVPIYTQPGNSGGIALDENYRVSLTGLSKSEVLALFASSGAGPLQDLGLAQGDTLLKLFAALPSIHRQTVQQMRQRFYIDPINWFQIVELSSFMPILQQAVWEDHWVNITYQQFDGQVTQRHLQAYALVAKANIWYLVARKDNGDMRHYRISRMVDVVLCDETFQRASDFDLADYWQASCAQFEQDSLTSQDFFPAKVRIHPAVSWYFDTFMGGRHTVVGERDEDGWITLDVIFYDIWEGNMRALGLGTTIEILEPPELRDKILETAQSVLDFYR